jgi:hypothetical protein
VRLDDHQSVAGPLKVPVATLITNGGLCAALRPGRSDSSSKNVLSKVFSVCHSGSLMTLCTDGCHKGKHLGSHYILRP